MSLVPKSKDNLARSEIIESPMGNKGADLVINLGAGTRKNGDTPTVKM